MLTLASIASVAIGGKDLESDRSEYSEYMQTVQFTTPILVVPSCHA